MNDKPFKNLFKINTSYWLLVVPILYTTVPWVNYRMRGMIPVVASMLWMLPKVSKIMAKFNCREGRAFLVALFWFLILSFLREIFAIIGSQEHMQYHHIATICMQLCYFLVAFYTIAYRKFNELRFMTIITLGGFILGGICSLRGLGVEGLESGRATVTIQNAGHMVSAEAIDNTIATFSLGLGGYSYAYYCAWMIGVALLAIGITKNMQLRLLYCAALIGCVFSVKVCGLGTPVAIVALEFALFVLWFVTRSRKLVAILAGILIFLYFIYSSTPTIFSPFAGFLEAVAENMSPGGIKERVVSVAEAFRGDASYANIRVQLQMKSWQTFFEHPFLGTFGPFARGSQMDLGGHSYVLDILGGYGLLGLFCLAMFVCLTLRYFKMLGLIYFGTKWLIMPLFFMLVFILSGIMNPVTFLAISVYLLPGLAYLSLDSQKQHILEFGTGSQYMHPVYCYV